MSELTFAVRFAHAAGPDRPGRLGQAPGGFSAAFLVGSFFFSAFALRSFKRHLRKNVIVVVVVVIVIFIVVPIVIVIIITIIIFVIIIASIITSGKPNTQQITARPGKARKPNNKPNIWNYKNLPKSGHMK